MSCLWIVIGGLRSTVLSVFVSRDPMFFAIIVIDDSIKLKPQLDFEPQSPHVFESRSKKKFKSFHFHILHFVIISSKPNYRLFSLSV